MLLCVLQIETELDAPFLDSICGELLLKLLVSNGLGQQLELLGPANKGFAIVASYPCWFAMSSDESVKGVQVTQDVE